MSKDFRRLDEIERDLLDDTRPLAGALRKCLALGGELRSAPLREWASRELHGYDGETEVPPYRTVAAAIEIDGATFNGYVKGQRISPTAFPDGIAEHVKEEVLLRGGVGELEDLVRRADQTESGTIKLSLPGAAEIARLMNHQIAQEGRASQQIVSIYWAVHASTGRGVLDKIRSAAVEIISELRASMPDGAHVPTPEAANQAVNVVVHGGRRTNVTVNAPQADNGSNASVTEAQAERRESGWTKTATIWTIIAGLVGIVAAYLAYLQLKG
jgi:hypothetical protein